MEYGNYNKFDHIEFLRNLDEELIKGNAYSDEHQRDIFTTIFRNVFSFTVFLHFNARKHMILSFYLKWTEFTRNF